MAFSGAMSGLMSLVVFFTTEHNPIVDPGFSNWFSVVSPLVPALSGALILFFNRPVVELALRITGMNGESLLPKMEVRSLSIVALLTLGLYLIGTEAGNVVWVLLTIFVNAAAPQTQPMGQSIRLPEIAFHSAGFVLGVFLTLNPHRVADFILRRVNASDTHSPS